MSRQMRNFTGQGPRGAELPFPLWVPLSQHFHVVTNSQNILLCFMEASLLSPAPLLQEGETERSNLPPSSPILGSSDNQPPSLGYLEGVRRLHH